MQWYEEEVAWMEARWRQQPPLPGAVVFYGSSSVRLWASLADDFPDLTVVNAGFGGSTLAACAHFAERLVVPLRPRSLLVYAGDNDLGDGRSPADVLGSFRALTARLDQHLPGLRLGFLSIKPSPARWPLLGAIREANRLIREELTRRTGAFFIDLVAPMLGADGRPRVELYAEDGLHLSAAGYRLWREVVEAHRPSFA
jgi:lysophospholipase L1-like esterase